MGASAGSEFISFPSFGFLCGFLLISTTVLFHLLGAGSTEKGGHPMGGSPEIRNGGTAFGGLWLGEDGSSSGRLRGEEFLLASEGSNVTFLCVFSFYWYWDAILL